MIKHPKRPRDPAQLAKLIVDRGRGPRAEEEGKDQAAVALGEKEEPFAQKIFFQKEGRGSRKGGSASLEKRLARLRGSGGYFKTTKAD